MLCGSLITDQVALLRPPPRQPRPYKVPAMRLEGLARQEGGERLRLLHGAFQTLVLDCFALKVDVN